MTPSPAFFCPFLGGAEGSRLAGQQEPRGAGASAYGGVWSGSSGSLMGALRGGSWQEVEEGWHAGSRLTWEMASRSPVL